ncbi:hypothetical protein Hanom_Chr13g01205851 [Helianthus anomalus]
MKQFSCENSLLVSPVTRNQRSLLGKTCMKGAQIRASPCFLVPMRAFLLTHSHTQKTLSSPSLISLTHSYSFSIHSSSHTSLHSLSSTSHPLCCGCFKHFQIVP